MSERQKIFIVDEKQVHHEDGWLYYVRDSDEGMVEIGYKDWDHEKRAFVLKGSPISISLDMAAHLGDILKFFASRDQNGI